MNELLEIIDGHGLDPTDIEEANLVQEWVEMQKADARTDLKVFFEFVMRHETTRKPLECAPHQRVLFDFVETHPRCVIRMPVGTSKTFSMAAVTLHLLGRDSSARGAIVSSTQAQAQKPLAMVRDTIEMSHELHAVFPNLRKSSRKTDAWTQTAITVDRPHGIRDPSLVSVGIDGGISGARLSWIVVDDILDRENTSTQAGLQKVHDWFDSSVLSRIDPGGGRIVVTNTPWHPDDLTYKLEAAGWPTLTMDILGNIRLANCDDFDSPDIVPSARPGDVYRLAAYNEPQNSNSEVVHETEPLWASRYSWADVEELKRTHLPHRFNQLYLCICRSDETARCKIEWIEKCKEQGRGLSLMSSYSGTNPTITGVDLAVGRGSQYDQTALFTFEQHANGKRQIIDIEFGQWDAPSIVKKLLHKAEVYGSIVRVENNAAQDYLIQFARAANASIPIKAHATGRTKAHPEFGVEGIFIEIQNGAWIIPCDAAGRCHPAVQRWIDECLYYQPGSHVGDLLMASWFAREQARSLGFSAGRAANPIGDMQSLAAKLRTR